jgi:hypothetical protein
LLLEVQAGLPLTDGGPALSDALTVESVLARRARDPRATEDEGVELPLSPERDVGRRAGLRPLRCGVDLPGLLIADSGAEDAAAR